MSANPTKWSNTLKQFGNSQSSQFTVFCMVGTKPLYYFRSVRIGDFALDAKKSEAIFYTFKIAPYFILFYIGNYDEGFGRAQRKADWVNKDANTKSFDTEVESKQQENGSEVNGHDPDTREEVTVNGYDE